MRPISAFLFTAAALTAGSAGCARNQPDQDPAPEEAAVVRIENDNVISMRISVVRAPSGAEYRLGTAPGAQVSTFRVPRSLVTGLSEVTFQVTPMSGGFQRFSRTITISPGDTIVLRIPPVLQ